MVKYMRTDRLIKGVEGDVCSLCTLISLNIWDKQECNVQNLYPVSGKFFITESDTHYKVTGFLK